MQAIELQSLVRRLLTHEATESRDLESLIAAVEHISDKLRAHLSKRIGQEGFRTLLARALILTTAQFPLLRAVRIGADGSLIGLRSVGGSSSQETSDNETLENIREGAVAFMACLFELLITFIGEGLTLRLLSTVWPEFALDDPTVWENETP